MPWRSAAALLAHPLAHPLAPPERPDHRWQPMGRSHPAGAAMGAAGPAGGAGLEEVLEDEQGREKPTLGVRTQLSGCVRTPCSYRWDEQPFS